jgi:hypothetical protein
VVVSRAPAAFVAPSFPPVIWKIPNFFREYGNRQRSVFVAERECPSFVTATLDYNLRESALMG